MQEILVVDDERTIREGLKLLLTGEGYGVRLARNGELALHEFRTVHPDLVLLDVMMPGMSGFRVCEQLRQLDPALPVIFLTARTSEADQLRALGLGGDDYVFKTAPDSILLARIRRAIARHHELTTSEGPELPRRTRLGALTVDFDSLNVTGVNFHTYLSKPEGDFLWILNSNPCRYIAMSEIAKIIGLTAGEGDYRALYMLVHRLKRKLGRYGMLIDCQRGVGYKLIR